MEQAERLCDRIGIVDLGRIRAEGTRRELVGLVGELDRITLTADGTRPVPELEALPGMLLGAAMRTEQQALSLGLLLGLGLGAIGGAMVPLDLLPATMRQVAHLTPHAWAMDGFAELLGRNGTIAAILAQLGVLAGYAAALFALGTWRLRAALTR